MLFLLMLLLSGVAQAQMNNQPVKLGIDVLRESNYEILRGKKFGLVAHPASMDSRFMPTVQSLNSIKNGELVALFGPEHGVYGDVYGRGQDREPHRSADRPAGVFALWGKPQADAHDA